MAESREQSEPGMRPAHSPPWVSRGQSPALVSHVLGRAISTIAEGRTEERMLPLLARSALDAASADLAAIWLHAESAPAWRLAGSAGLERDETLLNALPTTFGGGGGILAWLFQAAREVYESDLLDGAPEDAPLPTQLPARSLVGIPVRRGDGRVIGALLVAARRPHAFDASSVGVVHSIAQLIGLGIDNARLVAGQQRERRMAAESAVTLGTVLESVDSAVCVVELDGTVRVANTALQRMFGLPGPTAGTSQEKLFASAAVAPQAAEAFLARLRELQADPSQMDESEWELATEPPRIVQRYASPMRSLLGEVVGRVEVYTDVTESRRLYTQLLHSEKLRAIGEMASGVAHDFNNLLASIVGQTELLHPDELPPTTRHAIATIRQAALDGARMVRNLQGLARPRAEAPSTVADLNETVQLAVEMGRPRWAGAALHGQGPIDVRLSLADSKVLPRAAIDPSELREVLLNLLFNAVDAMPEGGRIEIATRAGRQPGTADIEVRDTGQGMPESVRARIFEPFYSTKGPKGSGLGLAVAYSILTRRGGGISVESRLGEGTTFTLSLPTAPAAATPVAEPPASPSNQAVPRPEPPPANPSSPSGGLKGARILVADDEPGLVTIVRQLMERSGAQVSIANGGKAALEVIQDRLASFDVVITDLDMPEVDGWAVAAAVQTHRPGTFVVMLTGWAGEIAPADFKARGVDVVLAKPCSRAELEAAIGNLLASRARSAAGAGYDVLLVDDEPAFARAVSDLLALQGHHVTVVDSVEKALEATAERDFDVVLTDYSLGELTGAQLAERLADRATTAFVVLVTGYANEVDDPSLLTRGVSAVLPKPCRGDDLRRVLTRVPSNSHESAA